MDVPGRPALRDLFDDAPTPLIGHPPQTHLLDFYVATDGSYRDTGGGLGAVLETSGGDRIARLSTYDKSPNNNVAEYRALHLGLDVLATRIPPKSSVGILVDHDDLARNVNAAGRARAGRFDDASEPVRVPHHAVNHWRGIRARLATFDQVRAARVDRRANPAHPLANDPEAYEHLAKRPARCVLPRPPIPAPDAIPPPSRADRHASD